MGGTEREREEGGRAVGQGHTGEVRARTGTTEIAKHSHDSHWLALVKEHPGERRGSRRIDIYTLLFIPFLSQSPVTTTPPLSTPWKMKLE